MAMAVAALGTFAGGYAGGKLKESIDAAGYDAINGKIVAPGVYTKPGPGKTKGEQAKNAMVIVDTTAAATMYQQAAQSYQDWAMDGLNFYAQSVAIAANELQTGYGKANALLQPLSNAGLAAMNEQMRMLGLPGVSQASGFANRLNAITPYNNSNFNDLQASLIAADQMTTAADRSQAKVDILTQMGNTLIDVSRQRQLDALGDRPGVRSVDDIYNDLFMADAQANRQYDHSTAKKDSLMAQAEAQHNAQIQAGKDWDTNVADINSTNKIDPVSIQAQIAKLGPRPTAPTTLEKFYSPGFGGWIDPSEGAKNAKLPKGATEQDRQHEIDMQRQQQLSAAAAKQRQYDSQVQSIVLNSIPASSKDYEFQGLINDFATSYSTEDQSPYTGQQVADKIAATPGYQFQLDAGTNAITRRGAATGMLQSGNTGAALVEYGQGLAQNTFNSYMANLQNISSQGAVATGQMAANDINKGQSAAGLVTNLGSAVASTYANIGSAYQQSWNNQSQLFAQTAFFNAGSWMAAKGNAQAANNMQTQAALGAAPGLMSANNTANQLGYQAYAGQAAANAYSGGIQMSGAWQQPYQGQSNVNNGVNV